MSNKTFWKTVKPFLTNKGYITNDSISTEIDGNIIRDEKMFVELFNENYINIKEIFGNKPSSLRNYRHCAKDNAPVDKFITKDSAHSSAKKIKKEFSSDKEFEIAYANVKDINQIIKSLNVSKTKGPNGISAKFVKVFVDIIYCHITNITNKEISHDKYSESANTVNLRAIFKKGDRTEIKNYHFVSLLNIFSKIYERFYMET